MRVSSLMVTLPQRRMLMARAIKAWIAQSHDDRELIIVMDRGGAKDSAAAAEMIAAFNHKDISVILPEGSLTLGALRNISVDHAEGDVICQWDDDDLHHPERIERQLAAMTDAGAAATILQEVMLYRVDDRALHWTNWAATPAGGHPGTLMCHRSRMPRYPEAGESARLGEDLALLNELKRQDGVNLQANAPELYVYVTHGSNAWPPAHHAMLATSLSISKGLLQRREKAIRDGLRPFGLDGVTVQGYNDPAFTL